MHSHELELKEDQEQSVIESIGEGISAGRIVAFLRQSGIAGVIARNIYEICANERRRLL